MRAITTTLLIVPAIAQINLGTFSFHPNGGTGWDIGMSQGANIFGFGGDRGLHIGSNDGGVGIQTSGGALIGGERIGVDSGLGVHRSGLDIGSQLQFGNNPHSFHPAGQLASFFENMRSFFSNLIPLPTAYPVNIPETTSDLTPISTNLSPLEYSDDYKGIPRRVVRPYRMGTEGRLNKGYDVNPFITSDNMHSLTYKNDLRPQELSNEDLKDGESTIDKKGSPESISTPTHKSIDDYPTDSDVRDLFIRSTERPRQLPGLIELN